MPFPEADDFVRLCDKRAVANEAERLGIRVPKTLVIEGMEDIDNPKWAELRFPLILKPHRSVTIRNGKRAKEAVRSVSDASALKNALAALPAAAFPIMLQERIAGPGMGIFVLLHRGELVAAFAHRRIREKPPWGGVSVYRESVPLDQDLLDRSVQLLRAFEFEGAAMVEYKLDDSTGTPYIMEINGRFWGSLQLAIDAGVDFPALLIRAALDEPQQAPSTYKVGTRSRWFWGDVDSLLIQLQGASEQNDQATSRVRACIDFVRAFGLNSRSEIFQLTDPMPAVRETLDWFGALIRSRSDN